MSQQSFDTERTGTGIQRLVITRVLGLFVHEIQVVASLFLNFGALGNIGPTILPRRKVKKMTQYLEYQDNKTKIQVNRL